MTQKPIEDIEADFRTSIEIPPHIPDKQFFFCPVGLVGAGKTTVTKPIAKRFGLVRLSSDELRKRLKENGYDYSALKEILLRIGNEFIEKGYSVALDTDCGNPEIISSVETASKKQRVKVVWVHIDTPESYIFEKFRKHPPSWLADNPQVMIDNYLAQKEKRTKENRKLDFLYTFDTSRVDLEAQLEECSMKMRSFLPLHQCATDSP